jgi:hypothetical protein
MTAHCAELTDSMSKPLTQLNVSRPMGPEQICSTWLVLPWQVFWTLLTEKMCVGLDYPNYRTRASKTFFFFFWDSHK